MARPVVVLVGLPAAGKTTVGRLVADALGVAHRDTDEDIPVLAGRSIAAVIATEGMGRLCELEVHAVLPALATHDGVLSLGARAVVHEPVRVELAAHTVGYLRVSVETATARILADTKRAWREIDPRDRVRRAALVRGPLYERAASFTVDTDNRHPADIAAEVCGHLATRA